MKKQLLFLLPAVLLSVFSCSENTSSESSSSQSVSLGHTVYTMKSDQVVNYVRLTTVDELNYVCRNLSAVVIIRQDTCKWCAQTESELLDYIPETNNIIFTVQKDVYLEAYESSENSTGEYAYLYPQYVGTPTFLFYREGQCQDYYIGAYYDTDTSTSTFEEEFPDYITEVNLYVLNQFDYSESTGYYTYNEETFYDETQLNELLASDPDANVIYVDDGEYPTDTFTEEFLTTIYNNGEKAYLFFRQTAE